MVLEVIFFPGGYKNATESYNGSTWTSLAPINSSRGNSGSSGIQTAALFFGGAGSGGITTATESWDGTSWTTVNSLNTSRQALRGAGTQTASVGFGGTTAGPTANLTATESWNGTSWTSNPTGLNIAKGNHSGASTSPVSSVITAGGNSPVAVNTTSSELYNGTTWSASATIATARNSLGGAGSGSSGVIFGGATPSATGATEEFTDPSFATQTLTTS